MSDSEETRALLLSRLTAARAFVRNNVLKAGKHWASLPYAYDYTPEEAPMYYLGWFDDNPKKTAVEKVKEAVSTYQDKFGSSPNVILVNEADKGIELGGVKIGRAHV